VPKKLIWIISILFGFQVPGPGPRSPGIQGLQDSSRPSPRIARVQDFHRVSLKLPMKSTSKMTMLVLMVLDIFAVQEHHGPHIETPGRESPWI
jgi:hypothetical protein